VTGFRSVGVGFCPVANPFGSRRSLNSFHCGVLGAIPIAGSRRIGDRAAAICRIPKEKLGQTGYCLRRRLRCRSDYWLFLSDSPSVKPRSSNTPRWAFLTESRVS